MIEEKFLVIFFLVLFFGVLIRALPLLKYTYVGIDSFFHLLVGEEITKKGRLPSKIGYFTISGTYAYPPLLHYIISYLLKYMSAKKVQFFSIIIDAINMGFIFIFGKYFFDEFVGIIGMALYASSPEVVKQSSNLNPRSRADFRRGLGTVNRSGHTPNLPRRHGLGQLAYNHPRSNNNDPST